MMSKMEKAVKKVCQEKSKELSHIGMEKDLEINDLPPEMLLEIFKKLRNSDLLSCRSVCRKWSSYVSKLCHNVEDLEIRFSRSGKTFVWDSKYGMYSKGPEFTLEEFTKCLGNSKNPPFVRFGFGSFLKVDRHLKKFLDQFGPTTKSLEINLDENGRNVRNLWNILTERAPNIQKLTLFGKSNGNLLEFTELFPRNLPVHQTLPNLKILNLCQNYKSYQKIVEDILNISPNLKRIEGPWEGIEPFGDGVELEDLEFLTMHHRIHLINRIYIPINNINPSPEKWTKEMTNSLNLKSLTITGGQPHELYAYDPSIEIPSRALGFILEILESSKNSLIDLNLEHIGFPNGLDWAYLKNIRSLSMAYKDFPTKWNFNFPSGCREIEIFPTLKILDFKIYSKTVMATEIFPTLESMPLMPSVKKISLYASYADIPRFIQDFGLMCPNTVKLEIGNFIRNFPEVVPEIWKNFKNLKSLTLRVDIDTPWNTLLNMDMACTGFSNSMQRRVSKMMNHETLNLDTIERIRQMPRRNPSLLDLKNFRKLTLQFSQNGNLRHDSASDLFEYYQREIGNLVIFKLMPNVELKLNRMGFCIYFTDF